MLVYTGTDQQRRPLHKTLLEYLHLLETLRLKRRQRQVGSWRKTYRTPDVPERSAVKLGPIDTAEFGLIGSRRLSHGFGDVLFAEQNFQQPQFSFQLFVLLVLFFHRAAILLLADSGNTTRERHRSRRRQTTHQTERMGTWLISVRVTSNSFLQHKAA